MRHGALVFNENTDRYDIRFDIDNYYGGLHCGDGFEVLVNGKWKATRIEMSMIDNNWYLVGLNVKDLGGLQVRI